MRYLAPGASHHFRLLTLDDPRFPLMTAAHVPPYFGRHLPEVLDAVSLRKGLLAIDAPRCSALLQDYAAREPDELRRLILLKAVRTREVEGPEPAAALPAPEVPLQPTPQSIEQYVERLNHLIVEYALGELALPELEQLHERLRQGGRRGRLAAIGPELGELGWDYDRLRRHARLGYYQEALEDLWLNPASGDPAARLLNLWSHAPRVLEEIAPEPAAAGLE